MIMIMKSKGYQTFRKEGGGGGGGQVVSASFDLPPKQKSWIVLNTNTYFVLNCNVLALLSFYALPSGGKSKDMVVHWPACSPSTPSIQSLITAFHTWLQLGR